GIRQELIPSQFIETPTLLARPTRGWREVTYRGGKTMRGASSAGSEHVVQKHRTVGFTESPIILGQCVVCANRMIANSCFLVHDSIGWPPFPFFLVHFFSPPPPL